MAYALTSAACLVDNPAYDLDGGDGGQPRLDALPFDGAVRDDLADAPVTADVAFTEAGAPDAGGPRVVGPGCDPNNSDLQFCLAFEGSLRDLSSNAVVVTGEPAFMPGADGAAYWVKNAVGLQTPATSLFALSRLSLDMWVKLQAWPETQTQVLVAVPDVMSLFITGKGELVCDVGNIRATGPLRDVQLGQWQGVACVYDGQGITMFINGISVGSRTDPGFEPTVTKAPLFVGTALDYDPFTGGLDNVRLWSRRLTPAELCKSAPDQAECSQIIR
ncbi:MAG: LamG domain-containing protein [Deltaproteobacteria bacterium]|nr:LamG domain-containing protein [Deltaproteobacteria bacterium]